MKNTSWFAVGDDSKARAVRTEMLDIQVYSKNKSYYDNLYFNKIIKWFQKAAPIYNVEIKYIDKENKEIYGSGYFNISDNYFSRMFVYDIRGKSKNGVIGLVIVNWRCAYPKIVRNFEYDSDHYPIIWPMIKSNLNEMFRSFEVGVFR